MADGKIRMGYEGREASRQATVGDDLWQLHAAGAKIAEFTNGASEEQFSAHDVLRAAVERMLVLMAEAWVRLHQADIELAEKFAAGPALHHMAERLDKPEDDISPAEVWVFLQTSLPGLVAQGQEELERWHQG